jgi:hypothetical protein
LRVFLVGDTDEGGKPRSRGDEFDAPLREVMGDMFGGGVGLPWNLAACLLIGAWLMCTRLTLGAEGAMANADHVIGALVITVTAAALADVARPVRFLNIALGGALLVTPFLYDAAPASLTASLISGVALILLSLRRGPISGRYGAWDRLIV